MGMERDNVIHLFEAVVEDLNLNVEDLPQPCERVFIDDERVILRTHDHGGIGMSPLAAKELAVRLIEAATILEQG
jgi:hypothetical protein